MEVAANLSLSEESELFVELVKRFNVKPRELGISTSYMYMLKRKQRRPSRRLFRKLVEVVNGYESYEGFAKHLEVLKETVALQLRALKLIVDELQELIDLYEQLKHKLAEIESEIEVFPETEEANNYSRRW